MPKVSALKSYKAEKPDPCGIEGCRNASFKKGVCKSCLAKGFAVEELCSVEGCELPIRAKGLCRNHYQDQYRRENGQISGERGRYELPAKRVHPVSTRVSDHCREVLLKEGAGHPNRKAAEILEEYARRHAAA